MPRPAGRSVAGYTSAETGRRPKIVLELEYLPHVLQTLAVLKQSIRTTITKQCLNRAVQPAVKVIRDLTPRGKGPAIDKHGNPRPRLFETVDKKVRRFSNGEGYYAVLGFTHQQNAAHDWIINYGTTMRFRTRIGGRFAWVETAPWFLALSEEEKKQKRRTGVGPAFNMIEKAVAQCQEQIARAFITLFTVKVMDRVRYEGPQDHDFSVGD